MLSHKPPTLSLPILCFEETPHSVKSSVIMTSIIWMPKIYNQMSAIYSGQIQECVKTWQNYILFILSNNDCVKSQAFFHGHTKILISRTPSVICSVQLFLVISGWKISHVIRFWLRLMINFCQSCISVDALHFEITSNRSCCEFCFIFCIESDRQHCSLEHVTDLLKRNHGNKYSSILSSKLW